MLTDELKRTAAQWHKCETQLLCCLCSLYECVCVCVRLQLYVHVFQAQSLGGLFFFFFLSS